MASAFVTHRRANKFSHLPEHKEIMFYFKQPWILKPQFRIRRSVLETTNRIVICKWRQAEVSQSFSGLALAVQNFALIPHCRIQATVQVLCMSPLFLLHFGRVELLEHCAYRGVYFRVSCCGHAVFSLHRAMNERSCPLLLTRYANIPKESCTE